MGKKLNPYVILKKSIGIAELSLFVLILFTCCVNSQKMSYGIVNAKVVWFFFILGLLLLFLSFSCYGNGIKTRWNLLDKLVCAWFVYVIANAYSHTGNLITLKIVQQLGVYVFFLYVKWLFERKKHNDNIFIVIFLSFTFIQICIAILQWYQFIPSFNSNFKFTGYFFNPLPFAIFLSSLLVFCISVFLYNATKLIKISGLIITIIGLPIIVIAFSRSAWVGLLTTSVISILLKFNLCRTLGIYFNSTPKKVLGLLLTSALIVLLFQYLYFLKKPSAEGRLLIWKISSKMITDNPVFGLGIGGMEGSFLKYQSNYFKTHPDKMTSEGALSGEVIYAFNDPLQILIEQGIFGFLIFLLIIVFYVKYSIILIVNNGLETFRKNDLLIGSSLAVILILIAGFFSYPLMILPIQIFFYCFLAKISSSYNGIFDINSRSAFLSKGKAYKLLLPLTAITYFTGGLMFLFYSYKAATGYSLAKTINEDGYDVTLPNTLKKTTFIFKDEPWFVLTEVECLLKDSQYKKAIALLEIAKKISSDARIYYTLGKLYTNQKDFIRAESQYVFLYYALPGLMKPKYELAKFYLDTKQETKWHKYAAIVIKFKPKVESAFTNAMKEEILKKNKKYIE